MKQANPTRALERAADVRTALLLALVALGAFTGIIFTQYSESSQVGLGVLGLALVGFVLATMTRRRRR
jgi:MYXO-CTERM domain-containing protein